MLLKIFPRAFLTPLGTVFQSNSLISTGIDMLLFTAVTTANSLFASNSNIKIGVCPPNTVSGVRTFDRCPDMLVCTIPPKFNSAGIYLFYYGGTTQLKASIWFPTTPPTISSASLQGIGGRIYVPDESVADYKAAQYWSNYASSIYGFSQLAIDYPDYYERYIHIYD